MTSTIEVAVEIEVAGDPVPLNGTHDIDSMARLSWLYSRRGLEDVVTAPFTPVTAKRDNAGYLILSSLNKEVKIAESGLPEEITSFYATDVPGAAEAMIEN